MINQNKYEQNQQNLSSIEGVTHSRDRDDLNEAINERLDRIEHAKANGQYISEEDWKFAIEHGGGPYQRTGGGDFRRIDIMRLKEDNHFRTRQYIEDEKEMVIDRQKQIQDIQQTYLDNLKSRVLAGDTDPNTITQTAQAIQQLNQLGQINPQVDTNVKQPHLRSEEEIRANQQSIEAFGQDLTAQNKAYEHFIHMHDTQRQQDQLIRQQQLGQLSQQDIQQMGGMAR